MKPCSVSRCKNLVENNEVRCPRCEIAKERVRLNRIALFERDPSRRAKYNAVATERKREKRRAEKKKPTYVPKVKIKLEPVITETTGYSLIDIPFKGCRFPVSNHNVGRNKHIFCGMETDRSIYCEKHRKIMYVNKEDKT